MERLYFHDLRLHANPSHPSVCVLKLIGPAFLLLLFQGQGYCSMVSWMEPCLLFLIAGSINNEPWLFYT